jgi:hypothetical protein
MEDIKQQPFALFQFLDHFIDPILVIITFILGFIVANAQVKKKERKELDSLFEYFNLYLLNQKDAFKRQIDSFKEYTNSLETLRPYNSLQIEYIIQPYEMFEVINKAELVQSFKRQNIDGNKAVKILTTISLFKENINIFKEAHNNLITRQNGLMEQWNLGMTQMNQTKVELLSIPKDEFALYPELIAINLKFNEFLQTGSNEPATAIDIIINPLIKYFEKVYQDNHLNVTVLKLNPQLHKLDRLYHEALFLIDTHRKFLNEIISLMEEKLLELNTLKEITRHKH